MVDNIVIPATEPGQLQITRLYFLALCYRSSTFVENPRQIHLFYAKQTQFTGHSNEHKFC